MLTGELGTGYLIKPRRRAIRLERSETLMARSDIAISFTHEAMSIIEVKARESVVWMSLKNSNKTYVSEFNICESNRQTDSIILQTENLYII